ncbi:hypothetical protein HPB49_011599 [Dermacentor silvarum]|uniref:Uncharacterized protein n=1 Tax=Dermacentor silvarum TaxID=543639 RepID=A0ACB8C3C4_DERSI|nr:hypothetical protein HPB49_011599 [Dermacentor silvarum]
MGEAAAGRQPLMDAFCNPELTHPSKLNELRHCVCDAGYVRNAWGHCITVEECEMCKALPNHDFHNCESACPLTCGEPVPVKCTLQCVARCACPPGYVRVRNQENTCVPVSQCSPICPVNSTFELCMHGCAPQCRQDAHAAGCTPSCHWGELLGFPNALHIVQSIEPPDGEDPRFEAHLRSWQAAYGIILHSVCIAFEASVLFFMLYGDLTEGVFSVAVLNILLIAMCVKGAAGMAVYLIFGRQFVSILNEMVTFEEFICYQPVSDTHCWFSARKLWEVSRWITITAYVTSRYAMYQELSAGQTTFLAAAASSLWSVASVFVVSIASAEAHSLARLIYRVLSDYMRHLSALALLTAKTDSAAHPARNSSALLQDIRLKYLKLKLIAGRLNEILQFSTLVSVTLSLVLVCTSGYVVTHPGESLRKLLFSACYCAYILLELAELVLSSTNLKDQIQLFKSSLDSNQLCANAFGFFTLDKSLLVSILASSWSLYFGSRSGLDVDKLPELARSSRFLQRLLQALKCYGIMQASVWGLIPRLWMAYFARTFRKIRWLDSLRQDLERVKAASGIASRIVSPGYTVALYASIVNVSVALHCASTGTMFSNGFRTFFAGWALIQMVSLTWPVLAWQRIKHEVAKLRYTAQNFELPDGAPPILSEHVRSPKSNH